MITRDGRRDDEPVEGEIRGGLIVEMVEQAAVAAQSKPLLPGHARVVASLADAAVVVEHGAEGRAQLGARIETDVEGLFGVVDARDGFAHVRTHGRKRAGDGVGRGEHGEFQPPDVLPSAQFGLDAVTVSELEVVEERLHAPVEGGKWRWGGEGIEISQKEGGGKGRGGIGEVAAITTPIVARRVILRAARDGRHDEAESAGTHSTGERLDDGNAGMSRYCDDGAASHGRDVRRDECAPARRPAVSRAARSMVPTTSKRVTRCHDGRVVGFVSRGGRRADLCTLTADVEHGDRRTRLRSVRDSLGVMSDDEAAARLSGKLHRFAVDQHRFLASFASCKYTRHGPGALFCFTNVGLGDLLVEEGEPGHEEARKYERQLIIAWGGVGPKAAPDCTVETLGACLDEGVRQSLLRSISEGCDRESFPVIVCAGMSLATEDVREVLRPPRVAKGEKAYNGEEGFSVIRVQYGDFRAALTLGLEMDFQDAVNLELDRTE